MKSLLFLMPRRTDEAVLASGALAHALELCAGGPALVACSAEAAPLFRGLEGVELRVLPAWARFGDWRDLIGARYDLLVDGRGGMLASLLPARAKVRPGRGVRMRHRAEDWSDAFKIETPLAPSLRIDARAAAEAASAIPDAEQILVLGLDGETPAARWPAERYAAVARRLAGPAGPLAGARIVAVGRGDAAVAASSLDADGLVADNLGQQLDPLALAAMMARATLFVGEDSLAMQIAAAAGAPTLALFGPTDERVRGPLGPRSLALRGKSFEALMAEAHAGLDETSLMEDVSVDAVEAAAIDVLRAGGLR